jgi:UPF0755 protein
MSFPQDKRLQIGLFLCIGVIVLYGYSIFFLPPKNFEKNSSFIVEEGESLYSISTRLESEQYIKSALAFRALISFSGRDKHIHLGGYTFTEPRSLVSMVGKFMSGKPDMPLASVTIPEGSTTHEIAVLLDRVLPNFSPDIFGEKVFAKHADGRLFPSTYFLLPSTTEERVVEIMTSTFEKKYADAFKGIDIPAPLEDEQDVVSLAAILEGEVKEKEDMQKVAGILLARLKAGIALQVDVAPITYKARGLPEQPISNPGLVSLYATLHPIATPYLYYITSEDGTMHYAKTFEEHKKNIQNYLR